MNVARIAGVWLVVACLAASQDPSPLPPEVVLLARIKSHMRDELARLPNYTCLETISRFHNDPANSRFTANRALTSLAPLDTVRLEIVYSDHREWYGSPGDRNLGAANPAGFVGSGLIGTGAFGSALSNILQGALFTYRGQEVRNGRLAAKYDFQLSRLSNTLAISIPGGAGTVGEKGSVWADPQSFDLIRLEASADDIPPSLPSVFRRRP